MEDHVSALIVAVSEAIEGAVTCLEQEQTAGVEACLRSARASIAALAGLTLPDAVEELAPNTDDPTTCGHGLPPLDLPGQSMCSTCGASRIEDGSWAVL